MKVAVVIGHHEKSKGAFSKHFGLSEWDFYNQVDRCLIGVKTFWHNPNISSYTKRTLDTAIRLNKENFDLVIELHFNSSDNPSAKGVETLYHINSLKGKQYALEFSELINEATGINLRRGCGLKALDKKDRGFGSVSKTIAPTILIEPFFGSNKEDCDKIKSPEFLAELINTYVENLKDE